MRIVYLKKKKKLPGSISQLIARLTIGAKVIKLFFMLNSAEHEIFSANKYENANGIFIFINRNFHAQLCLARKNLQL